MAARPPYGQNPLSNQPQYARQYSDSDADYEMMVPLRGLDVLGPDVCET